MANACIDMGSNPADRALRSGLTRWGDYTLSAEAAGALTAVLGRLSTLADVAIGLETLGVEKQQVVWQLARRLAARLPAELLDAVARLRRGELDVLVIDGEPEREGMPETIDAIDRLYAGSLYSDWLGLAYAGVLGAGTGSKLRTSHLRIEWQLGSESLHRDAMVQLPAAEASGRWRGRLPTAPFSSLRCLRPGSNDRVRTVIVHTCELMRELQPHLEVLSRPVFRCATLDRFNPPPGGRFALVARDPQQGWDVTQQALESSLFTHQRSRGSLIECDDPRGRAAVLAFARAREDLARYPHGVRWRAGRRLLLRQAHTFHGRDGGVRPRSEASWAEERWLSRCTIMQGPTDDLVAAAAVDSVADEALEDQIRDALKDAKRQWLARQEQRDALGDLVRSNDTTGSGTLG